MGHSAVTGERAPRIVRVATDAYHFYNFMHGQGDFLRRQGWDVHAILPPGEFVQKFSEREQIPVYEVDMHRGISPLLDLRGILSIRRILRELKPSIVHSSTPKAGYLAMIAATTAGIPVKIYHANGLRWWTLTGFKRSAVMRAQKIACRLADSVLCVSDSVRQAMLDNGVCSAEKSRVLARGHGNGVDADGRLNPARFDGQVRVQIRQEYGIPRDAVLAGFIGRLVQDKGIEEIAQAWSMLRDDVPDLHLLFIGMFDDTDPVTPETRRIIEDDPRITFTGWVDDVAPLYAAMDICLIPSYREGFPTTTLEAGAMALPVITTDALGCIDAVEPGVNGLRVRVGSAEDLRDAILHYVENPEERIEHGRAARQWVYEHYRHEVIWNALHEEYLRLITEKGLPKPEPRI